jgi:hypothetical protein
MRGTRPRARGVDSVTITGRCVHAHLQEQAAVRGRGAVHTRRRAALHRGTDLRPDGRAENVLAVHRLVRRLLLRHHPLVRRENAVPAARIRETRRIQQRKPACGRTWSTCRNRTSCSAGRQHRAPPAARAGSPPRPARRSALFARPPRPRASRRARSHARTPACTAQWHVKCHR